MGGSQSTRQIVIDNQPNTIVISQDVERRVLGLPERNTATASESKELTEEQLMAIKSKIEKDERQRTLRASNESHKIQAAEFQRTVQDLEAKYIKQSGGPICQDLQQEVYDCYQNNLKQPLNCSKQVKIFTETVEKARRNAIMTIQL